MRVQVGTIVDPAWATTTWTYFLNYATGLSMRDWTSPGYAMSAQVHSKLTFTAAYSDRDGYDTLTECYDVVASTYPGATERWYDGVDANCDGADDYDQDADGDLDPAVPIRARPTRGRSRAAGTTRRRPTPMPKRRIRTATVPARSARTRKGGAAAPRAVVRRAGLVW